jgi:hypothetical protein
MSLLEGLGQQAIRFSGLGGAVITLVGTLYMAYDLFGQRHGPLRILTEAITYVLIGMIFGTTALGVIALGAVTLDPYFVAIVSKLGAVSVLLAFGASGGFGAGLGYVLTIERKWNGGRPKYRKDRRVIRILLGLGLGIFEGCLVYAVMANFHHTQDVATGLFWGAIQGPPAGLLFGFLVALLLVHFQPQDRPASEKHVDDQLAKQSRVFDTAGLLAGVATGVAVGPMTATSYFALYGPFLPATFAFISLAGIIGGIGLGLVLATAERTLLWVDHLPPKRLGIAGVFFIFLGFLLQATQQISQIASTYTVR